MMDATVNYLKFAHQYVNCDLTSKNMLTSLLLHVPVT